MHGHAFQMRNAACLYALEVAGSCQVTQGYSSVRQSKIWPLAYKHFCFQVNFSSISSDLGVTGGLPHALTPQTSKETLADRWSSEFTPVDQLRQHQYNKTTFWLREQGLSLRAGLQWLPKENRRAWRAPTTLSNFRARTRADQWFSWLQPLLFTKADLASTGRKNVQIMQSQRFLYFPWSQACRFFSGFIICYWNHCP